MRLLAIAALVGALASTAGAQATEQALRDAQQRGSLDDLEALGAQRPVTPWTDAAWSSAAVLAERGRDYARARRDLEQVITTTTDDATRSRARSDLARLTAVTGTANEWTAVAARHETLAATIIANRGDPVPALRALEALVRDHAAYPGTTSARIVLAAGWEREGEGDRAVRLLRDAVQGAPSPLDRTRAQAELVRTLTRLDRLDDARRALAPLSDPLLVGDLTTRIDRAARRHWIRRGMLAITLAVAALAIVTLRRRAGSWRAAAARLRRPPAEAIYYVPIAALLAAVSQTGNPLVGRAIIGIALAGTAIAWLSGALLAGVRLRLRTVAFHAACAVAVMIAAAYLILDATRLLDLVLETWRGGPAMR